MVNGVRTLHGAAVKCTDLRGGAALVIAGLSAEGTTRVTELTHIDRGYDAIERDLAALRRTDPQGDYIETKRIQKLWHEIAARIADAGGEDFLS